ncbi:MAG: hypothetical protein COX90_01910 [Candidatus Nealsonbacteria bacterium CG_4_10_14_0_2_um_filter_38_17]|uniref:HEAT repeat domain-containing protein n=2 Tax=Candidatus Nealsoniibacteriota TaxID=1817911 RepID=A0A2M7UYE2_9BACT|nr:MAG: hypothetical protein COX36_03590 [Candidatus Nealsonbacteria bacterium CG23_combo_of_CG06-09_8_20_14_all_38_19]PIZ88977.1 MAG: hypothetical protein COX90_01910 [Candidatus Nealsonbacteria bacterium CG_4_10_14_0_2_um_filter_38_17]
MDIVEIEREFIPKLRDANPEKRSDAAIILGEIRSQNAVVPLIECLKDPIEEVRKNVAKALGYIKVIEAISALLQSLTDTSPFVRGNAFLALSQFDDLQCKKEALRILENEDHPWVLHLIRRVKEGML